MRPYSSASTEVAVVCRDALYSAAVASLLRVAGIAASPVPAEEWPVAAALLVVEEELRLAPGGVPVVLLAKTATRRKPGTEAVVVRSSPPEKLVQAVRSAIRPMAVAESRAVYDPASRLTDRQADIAALIRRGYKNSEIASELGLQEQTVKNVVSRMMKQRGLRNRVELIVWLDRHAGVSEGSTV